MEQRSLEYGSVVSHKEDQLPAEPNHYGKESPIIMNLFLVQNKYRNKMWNLDICGSQIYKKILNLKFMMMSREFLSACDTGEKEYNPIT
jgi:hypothetical protein